MAGQASVKNLEKAHASPNIGKHGLWKKTLAENKAREMYLDKLAEHIEEIVDGQVEQAKTTGGIQDRKEIINQMFGKPIERLEVKSVTIKVDL